MTLEAATTASTTLSKLQSQLLDYTGHVNKELPATKRIALVSQIQGIRKSRGWSPLDMSGR